MSKIKEIERGDEMKEERAKRVVRTLMGSPFYFEVPLVERLYMVQRVVMVWQVYGDKGGSNG